MDQVRPYLMADGGNVELVEIDGLVVRLRLQGACGSCPSSMTTMKMGIERRVIEKIPVRTRRVPSKDCEPCLPSHVRQGTKQVGFTRTKACVSITEIEKHSLDA